MNALELVNVSRLFGEKKAVDDLSLALPVGSFLGLLGRNGAGKSTTLKMVTGLLAPTSGTIHVLGTDLAKDPLTVKRQLGVMPENMALLERLTGPQYLRFVGRMYGLEDDVIERRRLELFEKLDLKPDRNAILSEYSFGMKKKISLCAALIHAPQMVVLDEPFEGIDPVTSRTIKDILAALQRRGVTLILTTHILEVVERLCPLVAILDEGKLKGFGPVDELRSGAGQRLDDLFVQLVGGGHTGDLSWL